MSLEYFSCNIMNLFLLQGLGNTRYFCKMFAFCRTLIILIALLISLDGFSSSTSSWGDWQSGKELYDSKKLEESFQEFLKHPKEDSNYYYNLGTISYLLGHRGAAVAYLEKANRLRPHDPDIQFNLSLAKDALGESIGNEKLDPSSTWIEQVADRISLDEVRATLGLLGLIIVLFWTRAYFKSRDLRKVFLQPAGILGLMGFGITVGIYGIQRWASATTPAVCLVQQTIRSGPGTHFVEIGQLDAGSKLRLLGLTATSNPSSSSVGSGEVKSETQSASEVWQQVRYSADGIGWIKSSGLLVL